MGYTHYWDSPVGERDQEKWDEFIKDCKELYNNMPEHSLSSGGYHAEDPLKLNGCGHYKVATFNKNCVWFNGSDGGGRVKGTHGWQDENEHGLDHETFSIMRVAADRRGDPDAKTVFGFCKTARKPYDLMVQAVLILYKHHFPDVQVSSDGQVDDWDEAFKFVAGVLPNGKEIGLELRMGAGEEIGLFDRLYDE